MSVYDGHIAFTRFNAAKEREMNVEKYVLKERSRILRADVDTKLHSRLLLSVK